MGSRFPGCPDKCQIIPERYRYAQTIRILFVAGLTLQLHLKSNNDIQKALKHNINTF
jgi:hypothetical protein